MSGDVILQTGEKVIEALPEGDCLVFFNWYIESAVSKKLPPGEIVVRVECDTAGVNQVQKHKGSVHMTFPGGILIAAGDDMVITNEGDDPVRVIYSLGIVGKY